jgi:hypothetical protein
MLFYHKFTSVFKAYTDTGNSEHGSKYAIILRASNAGYTFCYLCLCQSTHTYLTLGTHFVPCVCVKVHILILVILLPTNAHPLLSFYTSLYNLADMFRSVWTIIGASFT